VMNPSLSEKLRVATLIATILVVIRHAANIQAFFPAWNMPEKLCAFESGSVFLTDVAVPFFFFISGFFFMRHSYYGMNHYWEMIQKKAKTLWIPFVIWNLIGASVLFFHDKDGIMGNSLVSCFHNFLMSYWYGPLWYVRDIMLYMILWPLYGWMYHKYCQSLMVALILYLMWTRWWVGGIELFSGEGMVFFLLGGMVQMHSFILEYKPKAILTYIFLLAWIVSSFFFDSWDWTIHRICLLIGLPAFWFSIDLFPTKVRNYCLKLAPYSFLIYVTHFYLQKAIKVSVAYFFPENVWVALFVFFLVPIVCVTAAVILGRFWKQRFPRSYSICVGGR